MTDIVARLRAWPKDRFPDCAEAADEIERLTAEAWDWHNRYALGVAENERLREENMFLLSLIADELRALARQRDH